MPMDIGAMSPKPNWGAAIKTKRFPPPLPIMAVRIAAQLSAKRHDDVRQLPW
jgi:hypothetical protein